MGKRLAVIFPGIGYHCDKPILYYSIIRHFTDESKIASIVNSVGNIFSDEKSGGDFICFLVIILPVLSSVIRFNLKRRKSFRFRQYPHTYQDDHLNISESGSISRRLSSFGEKYQNEIVSELLIEA